MSDRTHYGWLILFLLFLAQFVMAMGAYAWGPLAPFLTKDLLINKAQVGAITSVFYLIASLVATPTGVLVDKCGTKTMLISSLSIMALSFILISTSGVYYLILFLSALAGSGYGMINQIAVKDLGVWFVKELRGTVMGIRQTGVTIGAAVGAAILPIIAHKAGWRISAMTVSGFLVFALVLVIILYKHKNNSEKDKKTFQANVDKKSNLTSRKLIWEIIKQPELFINILVTPLLAGSQLVVGTFLIIYLDEKKVCSSEVLLGTFLTTVMIAGTVGRICWGVVSDRLFKGDRIKIMILICTLALIATIALLLLKPGVSTWYVHFISVLLGLSFLGYHGILFAVTADFVPTEYAGTVTGIMITIAWIGMIVLPVLFGLITDLTSYSWSWGFICTIAGVCTIAYGCFFVIREKQKRYPQKHESF